jgi:glycerophosphoryl diester phosphodiesterase
LRAPNAPAWLIARPIAHRGLHDAARGVIENTLQATEAAIDAGFAVECDVQMSADGETFVFHDDALDRLTDASGPLIEKSAAEIRKARLRSPTLSPPPSPRAPGGGVSIPTFAELLALVAGRTPIVCELKSRFDRDWRLGDRIAAFAAAYDGPLALKSFDPDLVAYLRLRWPKVGPPGSPCPVGVVAQASYDGVDWDFLAEEQKIQCADWEELMRSRPDFVSFNVDDLPHKTPFFMKELHGLPVMTWTVRSAAQREAARKWADQIVFEGAGRP